MCATYWHLPIRVDSLMHIILNIPPFSYPSIRVCHFLLSGRHPYIYARVTRVAGACGAAWWTCNSTQCKSIKEPCHPQGTVCLKRREKETEEQRGRKGRKKEILALVWYFSILFSNLLMLFTSFNLLWHFCFFFIPSLLGSLPCQASFWPVFLFSCCVSLWTEQSEKTWARHRISQAEKRRARRD